MPAVAALPRGRAARVSRRSAIASTRPSGLAAIALVGEALPLAPGHTGVLSAAVEVYLMVRFARQGPGSLGTGRYASEPVHA